MKTHNEEFLLKDGTKCNGIIDLVRHLVAEEVKKYHQPSSEPLKIAEIGATADLSQIPPVSQQNDFNEKLNERMKKK